MHITIYESSTPYFVNLLYKNENLK